jgi:hypothetical protein
MAKTNEKVMEFVESELERNPDISVPDLQAKAAKVDSAIGDLTARQFNARYPLQVKRRKARASEGSGAKTSRRSKRATRKSGRSTSSRRARKAPAPASDDARAAVRGVVLRFASDLASAEERKELVDVLARVDGYVDEILTATGT